MVGRGEVKNISLGSVTLVGSTAAPWKLPGRDAFFLGERRQEDVSECQIVTMCLSFQATQGREQNSQKQFNSTSFCAAPQARHFLTSPGLVTS